MAHISQTRYAELLAAEKRLQDLNECKAIQPFADALTQAFGTVAAYTPWDKWPVEWQRIFVQMSHGMVTAARLYKDRLPKE